MGRAGTVREIVEVSRDPALLPALAIVIAYALAMIAVYQVPDWDYRCYINAGELLRLGRNPYSPELGTQYLYPPPLAHLLALALGVIPQTAIFWTFQSLQVILIAGAFVMLRELARRCGAAATHATLIAAAVTVFNLPMFYNVRHHQVNLVMLDAALLAMLFPRRAALSGLALAAATLLKLYPAVLLLPLWLFGYRRIAAWWVAGMATPLLFAGVRRDWFTFIELLPNMPKGEAVLDNSVASFIERGFLLTGTPLGAAALKLAALVIGTAFVAIALVRLARHLRERRFLIAMAEWSAVVLFLSPIAWEQHFVVALPLAVILLVERPRDLVVIAGCGLMLLVPRTPHYPFSHHYLAGLAALFAVSGVRSRT